MFIYIILLITGDAFQNVSLSQGGESVFGGDMVDTFNASLFQSSVKSFDNERVSKAVNNNIPLIALVISFVCTDHSFPEKKKSFLQNRDYRLPVKNKFGMFRLLFIVKISHYFIWLCVRT